MRKINFLFLFLLFGICCQAQKSGENKSICASDELLQSLIKSNPEVKERMDLLNSKSNDLLSKKTPTPLSRLTIPVVVAVVSSYMGIEDITEIQINSQLSILNTYFNAAGINFCLAKKDIHGGSTTGIIRINAVSDNTTISTASELQNYLSNFSNNYLKIWIVKDILGSGNSSSIQGFATFPNSSAEFDGIVMKYTAFGDVATCECTTLNSSTSNGKILVHEVGHYLGLYHTFEGGCSGGDLASCSTTGDLVCDTPPVITPNNGCPSGIDSCGDYDNRPDDINNYMDYVNESCMSGFSVGQIERMRSIISLSRAGLVSAENLIATGVTCTPAISAAFSANTYTVCSNNGLINFSGNNNPIGTTYSWNFGDIGSSQNTSTSQNPSHTYVTANTSLYNVTLIVTGTDGVSVISTKQVSVSNCVPILNSETNWRFGTKFGLNFSSGIPVPAYTTQFHGYSEAFGSQSNNQGDFLFDSSGMGIFDANENNIISSSPVSLAVNESAANGVVIVPHPSDSNKYYSFTRAEASYINNQNGFRYSVINVNGTAVTANPMNVLMPSPSGSNYILAANGNGVIGGEGVSAAKGCDGYWIVTSGKTTTGYNLLVYKLDQLGVISLVHETPLPMSTLSYLISFEFSPDGNKLLVQGSFYSDWNAQTVLYDFNKFTGEVSNDFVSFGNIMENQPSFSPDSKVLYVSDKMAHVIYQYNLNVSDVLSSRKIVSSTTGFSIQRGPDNKLYVINNALGSKSLAVIHKPNEIITQENPNACLFSAQGPVFVGPAYNNVGAGLPNMIDAVESTAYNNTISSYPNGCNGYKFFPNVCATAFAWNFGDIDSGVDNTSTLTSPLHVFSGPGTYNVTLKNSITNEVLASTTITVEDFVAPVILGDSSIGENTATNNSTVVPAGYTILWSATGGTVIGFNNLSSVTVNWTSSPRELTLTVTNPNGCSESTTRTIQESFGPNGAVFTTMSVYPNIIMGGDFTSYNGTAINRIAKLNDDMTLDTSFDVGTGANGAVYCSAQSRGSRGQSGVLTIGGKFSSFNGFERNGVIALRYTDGSVYEDKSNGSGVNTDGYVNAVDMHFHIMPIIGGHFNSFNGTSINNIARLDAEGNLDTDFSSGFDSSAIVKCLVVEDVIEKVIVGGAFSTYGAYSRPNVLRLNYDGTLDTTFNPSIGFLSGDVLSLAIQPNGKILVGGNFDVTDGSVHRKQIVRLNYDGSIDTTFLPVNLTSAIGNIGVTSIGLQDDGKIILGGGFNNVGSTSREKIVRLNADGTLDTTFDPGFGFGPHDDSNTIGSRLNSITVLDGSEWIIAGGSFTSYNNTEIKNIARIDLENNVIAKSVAEKDDVVMDNKNLVDEIIIYPNPMSQYFIINTHENKADEIEICNNIGQIVKTQHLNKNENTISVEELLSTIYFVKIYDHGKLLKTMKIVKQ